MIRRISASNFFSIGKRQTLDLVIKRVPSTPYVYSKSGSEYVNRAAVIFGNNGAGKTNFLKVLSFLGYIVGKSARDLGEGESIPYARFALDPSIEQGSSRIEVEFEWNGIVYFYSIELDTDVIYKESLFFLSESNRKRRMFERIGLSVKKGEGFSFRKGDTIYSALKPNVSLLSLAALLGHPFSREIVDGPLYVMSDVGIYGRVDSFDDSRFIMIVSDLYNRNGKWNSKLLEMIRCADLGISGIEYEKSTDPKVLAQLREYIDKNFKSVSRESGGAVEAFLPLFRHTDGGRALSFPEESRGTQSIYKMYWYILLALEGGHVLALDEFDSDIHPLNMIKIIGMFKNKSINKNNAQIILTAHSVSLLQELEREEIFFAQKDEVGNSHVYGLKQIPGVKGVDDYYAKYIVGEYGAIPGA